MVSNYRNIYGNIVISTRLCDGGSDDNDDDDDNNGRGGDDDVFFFGYTILTPPPMAQAATVDWPAHLMIASGVDLP